MIPQKTKKFLSAIAVGMIAFLPATGVFAKAVDYTNTPNTDVFFGTPVAIHNYITITNGTTGTKNITIKGLNTGSVYYLYTPAASGAPAAVYTGVSQVTNALLNQPYASGYTMIERSGYACASTAMLTCRTGATFYRTFTISSTAITTTAEIPTQVYGFTIQNSIPDDWNDMAADIQPLTGTITEHATAGNKVRVLYMGINRGNIFYNATLGYMPFNPNAIDLTPAAGTYDYKDAAGTTIFTLIVDAPPAPPAGSTSPSITIATSTGSNLFANVSSIIASTGFLYVLLASIALPLAFWVIVAIYTLFLDEKEAAKINRKHNNYSKKEKEHDEQQERESRKYLKQMEKAYKAEEKREAAAARKAERKEEKE